MRDSLQAARTRGAAFGHDSTNLLWLLDVSVFDGLSFQMNDFLIFSFRGPIECDDVTRGTAN